MINIIYLHSAKKYIYNFIWSILPNPINDIKLEDGSASRKRGEQHQSSFSLHLSPLSSDLISTSYNCNQTTERKEFGLKWYKKTKLELFVTTLRLIQTDSFLRQVSDLELHHKASLMYCLFSSLLERFAFLRSWAVGAVSVEDLNNKR